MNNRNSTPLVSLRDVGKTFRGGIAALRGLSLAIRDGEFVSLLGPSGCGKSTALRIVAGLIEPSAGEVVWAMPGGAERAGHDIGFVFQEPTLMPWASVAGNVFLPFRLEGRSMAEVQGAIDDVLEKVGLSEFARSYPRELSGGMKMRVSIARALVTHPKLLLMDEPFAALDEITRFRLNNDLLRVWQAIGGTVVFVTHSVFESVYLSERILVMTSRPGRVFAEIPIPAPYPRDEGFRTSADYAAHCRTVSAALHEAMAAEAVP